MARRATRSFGALAPLSPWKIDWIITGGETDQGKHKARPWHPVWFRVLRDDAAATGTAFQHKQNGEFHRWEPRFPADVIYLGRDGVEHTGPGISREPMIRVGKKAAGRLLDGVEYNARPPVPPVGAAA